MTRRGGHLLFWLLLLSGLAVDLVSKHFVFKFLSGHTESYDVWPGVFQLSRHYNTGGPFSLFRGHNSLLLAFTVIALLIIFYLYVGSVKRGKHLGLVALALIAAGALGNLVDRLDGGQVRDFLDFYIIHYPVFNVADILITVGAGLLVIELLRGDPSRRKSQVSHAGTTH